MHDSVAQAHRLIGARLRDSQGERQGQVVGVDQTRELPALLIVWETQVQVTRVPLSVRELHTLVQSCLTGQEAPANAQASAARSGPTEQDSGPPDPSGSTGGHRVGGQTR